MHASTTERIKTGPLPTEDQWLLAEAQRGAHFGSWRWELDTGHVHWSPELYALYGVDPERFRPSIESFRLRVHPDDQDFVDQKIAQARAYGGTVEFDFRIILENGATRVLWTRGEVTDVDSDGRPRLMSGINLDITERKRLEALLADSEERLRLATEAGNVGTFNIDLTSGTVHYSPLLARMLGAPGVTQVRLADCMALVHREDRQRVRWMYAAALTPGSNGRLTTEFRIVHRGGEVQWLAWSGVAHFNERRPADRRPVRFVGTCIDITERKCVEEALSRANEELEARVAERTRELEQQMALREQAQMALAQSQRMEAIGKLASGIAHDFNNLLTVISGNLEQAEARISDSDVRRSVHRAMEAVQLGAGLNRRLLSFARPRNLAPQPVALNDRVSEMQKLLERTLGEDISLSTQLDAGLWRARSDPGEVDSAIINIAVNARDAMPGGGELKLSTCNITFDKDAALRANVQPGDYVCLTISDTGRGMTPEVLQRAVEPFFTTKETGKGTGLGLSSVYAFARQSAGFMDIASEVGKGTSVRIYLPRAEETATPAESECKLPTGNGELVLVVEDNDQVRQLTLSRLESLGYDVIEARNGPDAIDILKSGAPIALVFSDVVMPGGMSGYDLARWVLETSPGAKVLLTSANQEATQAEAGVITANLNVLAKPYSRADLANAVYNALMS